MWSFTLYFEPYSDVAGVTAIDSEDITISGIQFEREIYTDAPLGREPNENDIVTIISIFDKGVYDNQIEGNMWERPIFTIGNKHFAIDYKPTGEVSYKDAKEMIEEMDEISKTLEIL